jgi:hypothetical protein
VSLAAIYRANHVCKSAPNRHPREIGRTALIWPRKSAQGRGPDRRRSGPLYATYFAGNPNAFRYIRGWVPIGC